ncbi:MAG: sirohydrochlorin chelatase [Planctomycetota bacterium]
MRLLTLLLPILLATPACFSSSESDSSDTAQERHHATETHVSDAGHIVANEQKIGVLLASHGSRSPHWRKMLFGVEEAVQERVLTNGSIQGIKTAFMEYTEPSIATRMKEFDAEGYTDVIVVPLFLTVSSHSFDDIPTILYQKEDANALKVLKGENIERYRPDANAVLTKELDFSGFLAGNVRRRVAGLSSDPANEGVSLIAYGSAAYNQEWEDLMNAIGKELAVDPGIAITTFGWCGHIVSYELDSTRKSIQAILKQKERALVIPVLVAYDEMFQTGIIGGAIQSMTPEEQERIDYLPDAILPDPDLEAWIVTEALQHAAALREPTVGIAQAVDALM